jgi:hypothetical protein
MTKQQGMQLVGQLLFTPMHLVTSAMHACNSNRSVRALQLLADPACWGDLGEAQDSDDAQHAQQQQARAPPPCSVGPLMLLRALCERHPPALSLALARLCAVGPLGDGCVAALAARGGWATEPLVR